jgi:hypothetical protein
MPAELMINLDSRHALYAERYAQCRADRVVAPRIGTFACRTSHRNTKASKRANHHCAIQNAFDR